MERLSLYRLSHIKTVQMQMLLFTIGINEVDLSHSFVAHTSAYDKGNSDPERSTRQVFLNSSTQLVGQARNSSGSGSSLFTAGAGQVVEYYA